VSSESFKKFLTEIQEGEVKTFLCPDVMTAISQLELYQTEGSIEGKVVVKTWEKLPGHEAIIEDILQVLARVALAIWPMWYEQEVAFCSSPENNLQDSLINQFKLLEIQTTRKEVFLPWLKAAVKSCQAGKLPLFKDFSRTIQVSQLALVIAPTNLTIVLAISDRHPFNHRLLSLANAATWLVQETKTRVVVLIPTELAAQQELDGILYGAILFPILAQPTVSPPTEEEAKYVIWPILGKPHPLSPGEQLLAQKLSQDSELASLFCFNQSVQTLRGKKYLVDLLWEEGKIVVEVDGYRHHGNFFAFAADRHRDYELLISGYAVLRLPHDEVINDVEITLEKIRDVVKFRRQQQLSIN
jgi:very-short-patch-repair endonuclease